MFFANLLLLIMGHCLADTALQSDTMAKAKRDATNIKGFASWWMWLTHHAMIQGLITILLIYLITRDLYFSISLGVIEVVTHWIIDFFKCRNKYNPNIDQLLHIGMKIIYCVMIKYYMGGIRWERLFFGM